jgi:hypothetical protein
LFAALRAVALCLVMQLSGVAHFALDLWLSGAAAAQHFHDSNDDDDGEPCPPGCPSCHCAHVSPALPVPSEMPAVVDLYPLLEVAWFPYRDGAPPPATPRFVYRPPRA